MGCSATRGAKDHNHGFSVSKMEKFEKVEFLGRKGNRKLTDYVAKNLLTEKNIELDFMNIDVIEDEIWDYYVKVFSEEKNNIQYLTLSLERNEHLTFKQFK